MSGFMRMPFPLGCQFSLESFIMIEINCNLNSIAGMLENTTALNEMKFDGIHCYAYFLMIFMIFGMIALMHACKFFMS